MKFDIDIEQVVNDMIAAAIPHLKKDTEKVAKLASYEFQQYIINIEHICTMLEEKVISKEEAEFLVEQHKLSMKAVMLAIEGIGLVMAQKAINAALAVLSEALKTALGTAFGGIKFAL